MATWIKDIVSALSNLGGTAHYDQLYEEIKRIRATPLPEAWKKIVQRQIQDHASESAGFKNKQLFYSVNGKGSGVWGLLQSSTTPASSGTDSDDVGKVATRRNQAWSRDELILALDLYLRYRRSPPNKDSLEINELSDLLNKMNVMLRGANSETFRNANGVYMKLMNFRRFDPEFINDGKIGLARGNKDEEVVWVEFSHDERRLHEVASSIRQTVNDGSLIGLFNGEDESSIVEAEEGRVLTKLHRVRERNRALVEQCKKNALKKHGRLACEACGFDFLKKYGAVGEGLIDVHHTKPVHTLVDGDKTKLTDLVLLCSNCHRVVHSSRQWLTVEQVKAAIKLKLDETDETNV